MTAGEHENGVLGVGKRDKDAESPLRVTALDGHRIVDVASGCNHCAALDDRGTMWLWGS